MKRILSFIMSAAMLLSCFAVTTFAADPAVENVESLISAIGEVKYMEYSGASTVDGARWDVLGEADGYTVISPYPASNATYLFDFSFNSADASKDKALFGIMTQGGNLWTGYSFKLNKFIVGVGGGWYASPINDLKAESDVIKLTPNLRYVMEICYNTDAIVVKLNGDVVLNYAIAFDYNGGGNYVIPYPQDCSLNIFRYSFTEGSTVHEDTTDITASTTWDVSPAGVNPVKQSGITVYSACNDSASAINDAMEAYNALNDTQKTQVSNAGDLVAAQNTYEYLGFKSIFDQIGEVTKESKDVLKAATDAYEALGEGAKKLAADDYAVLCEKQAQYDFITTVGAVDDIVAAIDAMNFEDTTAVGGDVIELDAINSNGQPNYWHMSPNPKVENGDFAKDDRCFTVSFDYLHKTADVSGERSILGGSNNGKAIAYDFIRGGFIFSDFSLFYDSKIEKVDAFAPFNFYDGVWYHIEYVYDETDLAVKVNGQDVLTKSYESDFDYSWYIFYPRHCNGYMDNFQFHTFKDGAIDNPSLAWNECYKQASLPETTIGESAKAVIIEAVEKYNALSEEAKAQVADVRTLRLAAEKIGLELKSPATEVRDLINATNALIYDDTQIGKSDVWFSELVDRNNGYGTIGFDGDKTDDPWHYYDPDKYIDYEYDVIVYDVDAENGYPLLGGYCSLDDGPFVALGYDFAKGCYYAGALTGMDNGTVKRYDKSVEKPFLLNVWHHLRFVYDNKTVYIYADGEQVLKYEYPDTLHYQFLIHYPQWIECEFANVVSHDKAGNEYKATYNTCGSPGYAGGAEFNDTFKNLNKAGVEAARAAYEALPDAEKANVPNYSTLVKLERQYLPEAVQDTINKIEGAASLIYDDTAIEKSDVYFFELDVRANGYAQVGLDGDNVNDPQHYYDAEKYIHYEYDVMVYDVDKENGYPLLGGYSGVTDITLGYDFVKGCYFAGNLTGMDNGKVNRVDVSAEVPFILNAWHHIEYTYDGNTVKIVADGKEVINHTYTDREVPHNFVIHYPQWIECEIANCFSVTRDGTVFTGTYNSLGSPGYSAGKTINTTFKDANKAVVEAARAAYDALSDADKALVDNYADLTATEALITNPAVTSLIESIDALGDVKFITLNKDADKIELALQAYNKLSDEDKAKVTNYQKLVDAKAKVDSLDISDDDATVRDIMARIEGVATLTKEDIENTDELLCIDYNFYEIYDRAINNCGYSAYDDAGNSKVKTEKYNKFEFDVKVNGYDSLNGSPLLGGYVAIGSWATGYDFINKMFYFGNYTSMDNGKLNSTFAEAPADFALGIWHHMIIEYNGANVTINFDGVDVLTATCDTIEYNFWIFYPQWINAEIINVVYTAADGAVVAGPLSGLGGAWTTSTIRNKTMGDLNKECITDVRAAYEALSDSLKAKVTNIDKLVEAEKLLKTGEAGDVNGDGIVNSKDVAKMLQKLADWDVKDFNADLQDYNGDGSFNAKDVAALLKVLAGYSK